MFYRQTYNYYTIKSVLGLGYHSGRRMINEENQINTVAPLRCTEKELWTVYNVTVANNDRYTIKNVYDRISQRILLWFVGHWIKGPRSTRRGTTASSLYVLSVTSASGVTWLWEGIKCPYPHQSHWYCFSCFLMTLTLSKPHFQSPKFSHKAVK